jgi:hypothetical protein
VGTIMNDFQFNPLEVEAAIDAGAHYGEGV